jgi:hypothetical protein
MNAAQLDAGAPRQIRRRKQGSDDTSLKALLNHGLRNLTQCVIYDFSALLFNW